MPDEADSRAMHGSLGSCSVPEVAALYVNLKHQIFLPSGILACVPFGTPGFQLSLDSKLKVVLLMTKRLKFS